MSASGDYNNDGFEDLFVTCWGQNVLYRNNGDGTFTDVTRAAGLADSARRWGTGCTFLDYDRDGHLDLFVSNYLDFDLQKAPKPGQNANCRWLDTPVTCGPRGFPYGRHSLYRNKGDGTFTDVSAAVRNFRRHGIAMGSLPSPATSTMTAGRTSTSPAIPLPACCS